MNWLEKVDVLKVLKKKDTFIDVLFRERLWEVNELREIKKLFLSIPQTYENFINDNDCCSIAFVVFFGSKSYKVNSLKYQLQEYSSVLKKGNFPFADDADGSKFLFNSKGQVVWWDKFDYDFEQEPKLLANSFEEFIGDCLLGSRYKEFVSIDKSSFYKTLKSQGWV